MCKFPTMTARSISEFPERADFSPLHSRLWKTEAQGTHWTSRLMVMQAIETACVSPIFAVA
jgi:hypothetical protein